MVLQAMTPQHTLQARSPPSAPRADDVHALHSNQPANQDIISLGPDSDLVLAITHDVVSAQDSSSHTQSCSFIVSIEKLRKASYYFDQLLDPAGFAEGHQVASTLALAIAKHKDIRQVALEDLPTVTINDVGAIGPINSLNPLIYDFLRALHGQPSSDNKPSTSKIANLCIVADRFQALDALGRSDFGRQAALQVKQSAPKSSSLGAVERHRQRLLAAMLLAHDGPRVRDACAYIVLTAPSMQRSLDLPYGAWWQLPRGLEEELSIRRHYILDTISSIQSHVLEKYVSRTLQCRLGYDSSLACDSFQLGQMVRFFLRSGTLDLSSMLTSSPDLSAPAHGSPKHKHDSDSRESDTTPRYDGDINLLLETLRQCPSYQLDSNHMHCGLRAILLPLLDLLQSVLVEAASICMQCWNSRRKEYAWTNAKRPLTWSWPLTKESTAGSAGMHGGRGQRGPPSGDARRGQRCKHVHGDREGDWVRDMFLACHRVWT